MKSHPPLKKSLARRLLGAVALGLTAFAPASFAQLYSENFNDGVADNWVVASGTWNVIGTTDKVYESTSTGAGPEIAYYNNATFTTDYAYSASVKRWGTGWNNQVGLIYYYKDASNYYRVGFGGALDPSGHNIHLWERVGGVENEVASGVFSGVANPATVTIVRSGNVTTIKLAGTTYITQTQTALTGGGKIGAFDVNAAGQFNDVTVVDSAPPTVALTAPTAGAPVRGSAVTLTATAADTGGSGLAGVTFKFDGTTIGSEDTTSPYSVTWNTTSGVSNGSHTLTAVARDGAGNLTTSAGINVTVDNAAPTVALTSPAAGAVSGVVTLAATASDTGGSGLVGVQFKVDGANQGSQDTSSPYSTTWDSGLATPGTHSITAIATDAAGNTTTSTAVNVTVSSSLPPGWAASDVGSPGATGSTSQSSGSWVVEGAGTNIWNTADEFQFASQSISGDCTVIARVNTIDPTATWSKAGIMIRETTASTSKYVLLAMTPTRGLLFEARTSTTSPNNNSIQPGTVSTAALPQWLKLVRTGDVFSAFYSTDGVTWSSAGLASPTVTVSMAAGVSAGLAVCSTVHGTLCTATFDNVSVATGGGGVAYNPPFPRLGIYAIGGDQSYPPPVWPVLAKFNVVYLAGNWEGWGPTRTYTPPGGSPQSYTRESMVQSIKSTSVVGTKVFQYVIFESVWNYSTPIGNVWNPTWRDIANSPSLNWWLWTNGTSGNHAISDYNANQWVINNTHASPKDSSNQYPFESAAAYAYDMFINGNYNASAAPSLDGFYLDNVFWQPRARDPGFSDGADWDRNGTKDANTDPAVRLAYRTGQKDFFTKMTSLMAPGKLQVGNIADWPQAAEPAISNGGTPDLNALTPLNGLLNGGLFEHAVGRVNSPENYLGNGTKGLMAYYKYNLDAVASPKLMVLEHSYLGPFTQSNGNTPAVPNPGADRYDSQPYRAMRYSLCCTLMRNGYYSARGWSATATQSDIQWYDEYDNKGTAPGYLGYPVAGATGAEQDGPATGNIWRREFQNGIVLMIEKGATVPQTITLPNGPYKRLGGGSGWQDSVTNNGATNVTTVTFNSPRDGLILLRQ